MRLTELPLRKNRSKFTLKNIPLALTICCLLLPALSSSLHAQTKANTSPVVWSSIDTQSDVEFTGGDVFSLASARLLDANGQLWMTWDTTLTPENHKLDLINSRREKIENVRLTDIALIGDSGLFICGEQGVLLESRNWGKLWSQRYFPNLDFLYFYGVEFDKRGNGILVGVTGEGDVRYKGIMYRSADHGKTWSAVPDVGGMGFSDVTWDIISNSFVVTGIGSFLISHDMGATWETVKTPSSELMRDTQRFGELVVSVGLNGEILKSNDGGETWEKLTSPTLANLTSLHVYSPANWYVAGNGGEVWETRDGGENWNALHLGTDATINGVKRTGPRLVVWGAGGLFMKRPIK